MAYTFNVFTGNFDIVSDTSALVRGPASATNNAIPRYDGTTGKLVKDSLVTISDSGVVTAAADGVASLDLITKQQLDAAIQGVDVKEGVHAATTANITLSGTQTVDGVALIAGNRCLVKNQSTIPDNGIYIVDSGSWTRSSDANTGPELEGAFVSVQAGTVNANTGWYQSSDSITIGVTNIVFNQFFGAGTYTADGQGIELTGSTFGLELDGTTLSKSASGLKVADQGISNSQVNNSAAIAYSKLNLSNSIVNADVNTSAAIAYSKLNLATSIVNADINASAAIDATKIHDGTVSNAEFKTLDGVTSSIQTQLDGKTDESTLTTKGDLYVATGASTVVRQGVGTDGHVLTADSAQTNGLKWAAVPAPVITTPTVQKFTSGSGTYTTPANVKWIRVRMVGAGGGGGGSGNNYSSTAGTTGGTTTFGSSLLTATGGAGGNTFGSGGSGGAVAVNSPAVATVALQGGRGQPAWTGISGTGGSGGNGGVSPFGGAGGGGTNDSGQAAIANSGSGGGGAGGPTTTPTFSGSGGGAGGYIDAIISAPSASYSYAVGASGAGAAGFGGGHAGNASGSGVIIVEEYYI